MDKDAEKEKKTKAEEFVAKQRAEAEEIEKRRQEKLRKRQEKIEKEMEAMREER